MNDTKNSTKKVGRPKKFNRDEALTAAMSVFWKRGFDGASMKNLTDAMGINGPSLYAEFGDKEALYKSAIDCYASNDACAPLVAFETEPNIEDAVRAFFTAAINYASDHESGARGCFLASSVATTAGCVEGVDELLCKAILDTDHRLAFRLQSAIDKGELPPTFPALERARLMFDLRQGFVFRARAGLSADAMMADIDQRVRVVLAE
ncbi:MAG: TetR/AcrR family transcriptional regulator [Pseudomonadota bacterium]